MPHEQDTTFNASPWRVVLVGHCGPDTSLLRGVVSRALPGAKVQSADSAAALAPLLGPGALLLVNRVLEGGFDGDSGIDLIRAILADHPAVRTMLISNFPDARRQAEEAGAHPGFGKRDLYAEETSRRLRLAVADESIRAT